MSRLLIVFFLAFLIRLAVAAEPPVGYHGGLGRDYSYKPAPPPTPPRLKVEEAKTISLTMPGEKVETKAFKEHDGITFISEKDGLYKIHLNNGNILTFTKGAFHRTMTHSWAPVENGLLVLNNDGEGTVQKSIYVTNSDLMKIAEELDNVSSKEEIVGEMVLQDTAQCLQNLKIGATAFFDTLGGIAESGKRLVDGKKPHGSFNYDATSAQCEARRRQIEQHADKLQKMVSKISPTLEKFPKEQWPAILTILLGKENFESLKAEGGLPGDNTSKLSNVGKGVHTATAAVEGAAALRLMRKPIFKPKAPPTTRLGTAKARLGMAARWTGGAVLLYEGTKRTLDVWVLDTDPTWSPVASAVLASEAGERVKNWISQNRFVTDKQKHRLRTDEFFQSLDDDPRRPEGIPQPPAELQAPAVPQPPPAQPAKPVVTQTEPGREKR